MKGEKRERDGRKEEMGKTRTKKRKKSWDEIIAEKPPKRGRNGVSVRYVYCTVCNGYGHGRVMASRRT